MGFNANRYLSTLFLVTSIYYFIFVIGLKNFFFIFLPKKCVNVYFFYTTLINPIKYRYESRYTLIKQSVFYINKVYLLFYLHLIKIILVYLYMYWQEYF